VDLTVSEDIIYQAGGCGASSRPDDTDMSYE